MSNKSWSLIAKGERPPASSQSKVREKQTQHLLNRTTHPVGQAFPRPIGPTVPAMLVSPAIDEARDLLGQIRPRLSSLRLAIRSEVQQQRNSAEHVTRSVAPIIQPSNVAFDRFAEPMGSDAVNGLRFDVIFFKHSNFLSEPEEGELPCA